MKVWPVKHSPLLRQPERFIARSELQALIRNVTQNTVNIKDDNGQFYFGWTMGESSIPKVGPVGSGPTALGCTASTSIINKPAIPRCAISLTAGSPIASPKVQPPKR